MTDFIKSRKPFKSRSYGRFQHLKKTNRNRKLVPQMTDFGRKACKSQHFQMVHGLKKPYTVDIHFDTYGIVALTEKQCIHDRYNFVENSIFTVFYRIILLCTAVKKTTTNGWNTQLKNVGRAHSLKPYSITFKIVQS